MNITLVDILCFPFGGMFNIGLLVGFVVGFLFYAFLERLAYDRMMRQWFLWSLLLICSTAYASPVLLDSIDTPNGDGSRLFVSQPGGWWRDDEGVVRRTEESLKRSDGGVWDVENISAPHKVYAATDAAWWRVDPPAGEAAGFEIQFATVSLFRFIDSENWEEKTIDWARVPLTTEFNNNVIDYPLFNNANLYVISTPNGYKSNFFLSNPALIPSPTSAAYFGPAVDLETVYFAVRYSVNKWPDSEMVVDGETMGPGGIDAGYSAEFGDDLWMLPTKAYRNVTGFNGVSWRQWQDESYVYYVFDRLSQEILVLAPFTLCVGADNILIDPTTWTSGRSNSDSVTWISASATTTNYGTDGNVLLGYYSSAGRTGLMEFTSLPSASAVDGVSATFIAFYDSVGGQSGTGDMTVNVGRSLRPWGETTATWNVYDTGLSWGTAGSLGSGTDYDSTTTSCVWGNAGNIVLSNNAVLNGWIESWIEGTLTNNGIVLFRSPTTTDYRYFASDDNADASLRPYLAITYTKSHTFGGWEDVDVQCVGSGGMVGVSIICPVTTTYLALADVIDDVTGLATTPAGTSYLLGEGPGADYGWDYSIAADTIDGATAFILGASVGLELPTQLSLYLESGETGATDERYFTLDWGGGSGSGSTDVLDAIADLSTDVSNNQTDSNARISNVSQGVQASYGMISSVSTEVDAARNIVGGWVASVSTNVDASRTTTGGWVASVSTVVQNASTSIEAHVASIAADVDILVATGNFLNDNVKVSRAYYNTDTALTNGEFQRDVPANALSHVESRWLPVSDVIAENWGSYVKQEYVIYSYPDSAAGTVLASHLIPSSTAPTERTWTDKGASLW